MIFNLIQADAWEAPYIGLILVLVLVGLAVWSKIDDGISKPTPKKTQVQKNNNNEIRATEMSKKPMKTENNKFHQSNLFFSTNYVDVDWLALELESRMKTYSVNNELSFFIDGIDIEELLGIDFYEYAKYFKQTFSDSANPSKGFQIDHIKPISRAITTDELKSFLHYTNTRAETYARNREKYNLFEYEYFYRCLDQKRHYNNENRHKYFGYEPKSEIYDRFKGNTEVLFNLDYRFNSYRYNSAEKYLRNNLLKEEEKNQKLEYHKEQHDKFVYDVTMNEEIKSQLVRPPTEEELKWKPENYIYPKPVAKSWEVREYVTLNTLNDFNKRFHSNILEDPREYLKLRDELLSKEFISENDFKKALTDFGYL